MASSGPLRFFCSKYDLDLHCYQSSTNLSPEIRQNKYGQCFFWLSIHFILSQSMLWRKDMDIDNLDTWDMPEVLKKYFAGGIVGYDKEGSPIWVDVGAQMDWNGKLH